MKVTIERTALLKALGHVHRIVERRNTIPILSNVLIEALDRQLTLKSTDLDLEATESAPADVAQAGATTNSRSRAPTSISKRPNRRRPTSPIRARPPCRRTSSTTSCANCLKGPRSVSK